MSEINEIDEQPQNQSSPTPEKTQILNAREIDFINAKSFLQMKEDKSGKNLYDHLSGLLRKILAEKCEKAFENLEKISLNCKRAKFYSEKDTICERPDKRLDVELALTQKKLYETTEINWNEIEEQEEKPKLPNLWQTAFYFEKASIGLNREEMVKIWLSMKQLLEEQPIASIRFWGKIFGTQQNYYIVECEMDSKNDRYVEPIDQSHAAMLAESSGNLPPANGENAATAEEMEIARLGGIDEDDVEIIDEPPKSDWKPPPEPPVEETGTNRKVYFVCNDPGKAWSRLPNAKPIQISTSRNVRKVMTGNLEAIIHSYPPFPGREKHFLRTQIARISAGTHISPMGFYQFDEEDEEEEEEGGAGRENFIENPDFEAIPTRELIDTSFANWVHHVMYILPQGRTNWWNPASVKTKDENAEEDEDEEEEEQEEMDEPEPETGPPLLTPLSEDAEVNGMPAWTARLSSSLIGQFSLAVLSSNLWPGAHAFATGRTFDNVYVGWAVKYVTPNLSPIPLEAPQQEFPSAADITEIDDPTPEEEAALRAAKAEQEQQEEEGEEEEEEEEEED